MITLEQIAKSGMLTCTANMVRRESLPFSEELTAQFLADQINIGAITPAQAYNSFWSYTDSGHKRRTLPDYTNIIISLARQVKDKDSFLMELAKRDVSLAARCVHGVISKDTVVKMLLLYSQKKPADTGLDGQFFKYVVGQDDDELWEALLDKPTESIVLENLARIEKSPNALPYIYPRGAVVKDYSVYVEANMSLAPKIIKFPSILYFFNREIHQSYFYVNLEDCVQPERAISEIMRCAKEAPIKMQQHLKPSAFCFKPSDESLLKRWFADPKSRITRFFINFGSDEQYSSLYLLNRTFAEQDIFAPIKEIYLPLEKIPKTKPELFRLGLSLLEIEDFTGFYYSLRLLTYAGTLDDLPVLRDLIKKTDHSENSTGMRKNTTLRNAAYLINKKYRPRGYVCKH